MSLCLCLSLSLSSVSFFMCVGMSERERGLYMAVVLGLKVPGQD